MTLGGRKVAQRFLTADRKRSLAGSAMGVAGAVALAVAAWRFGGGVSREAVEAVVLLAPAFTVFALTLAVALGRFVTATFDPVAGPSAGGRYLPVTQRALTNTLEQGVVFAASGVVLANAAPAWGGRVAVALAITFVVARAAFWLGYLRSTFGRAPGMAATMLVNGATLALAVTATLT